MLPVCGNEAASLLFAATVLAATWLVAAGNTAALPFPKFTVLAAACEPLATVPFEATPLLVAPLFTLVSGFTVEPDCAGWSEVAGVSDGACESEPGLSGVTGVSVP